MIKQIDFFGDANIGLYAIATDKFFLHPFEENFSEVLKVPSYKISLADSEFIGLFSSANSNGIIVPKIAKKEEIDFLKKLGINVLVSKEKFTAIGNLVCLNDKGALVSELLSKNFLKEIEDFLAVEAIHFKIGNIKVVGSACFATNKGALVHRDASDEEIEKIEDVLKVKAERASVNFGSPFVKSGIIANSFGALIGSKTSGYEIDIIIRTLKLSLK